jgi:hypothetical protein
MAREIRVAQIIEKETFIDSVWSGEEECGGDGVVCNSVTEKSSETPGQFIPVLSLTRLSYREEIG